MRRSKASYLGVSVLVLSLLLSACVATVIYMSVRSTPAANCDHAVTDTDKIDEHTRVNYQSNQHLDRKPNDEAHLNLKDEDGSKVIQLIDCGMIATYPFYFH